MSKKVLITGASRGIGRDIAMSFAKDGCDLVLCCKNNIESLEELAREIIRDYGVKCSAYSCDVSDYEQVKELAQKAGDIDILINNAGVAWIGLLTDMEVSDWRKVMGTNLDSLFYTCKAFVPGMVRNKSGRIINISSVWGSVGASCEVAYSASKGAVDSFTKALAKELAPSGISVNAVSCGVIDTDMNREHLSDEDLRDLEEEIPAGRMGKTSEVGELGVKISQSPIYMRGQIIKIDGGWI